MYLIYSKPKRKLKISHTIRFLTRYPGQKYSEVPSHFCVLFNNGIIMEATFSGVRIDHIHWFEKRNNILKIFVKEDLGQDNSTSNYYLARYIEKYYKKKYDFKALFVYFLYIMRRYLFQKELPDKEYGSRERFYCSELISLIDPDVRNLTPNDQMLTLERMENYEAVNIYEISES